MKWQTPRVSEFFSSSSSSSIEYMCSAADVLNIFGLRREDWDLGPFRTTAPSHLKLTHSHMTCHENMPSVLWIKDAVNSLTSVPYSLMSQCLFINILSSPISAPPYKIAIPLCLFCLSMINSHCYFTSLLTQLSFFLSFFPLTLISVWHRTGIFASENTGTCIYSIFWCASHYRWIFFAVF